jgi:hypothetical protein
MSQLNFFMTAPLVTDEKWTRLFLNKTGDNWISVPCMCSLIVEISYLSRLLHFYIVHRKLYRSGNTGK